jgi:hypothetical protein
MGEPQDSDGEPQGEPEPLPLGGLGYQVIGSGVGYWPGAVSGSAGHLFPPRPDPLAAAALAEVRAVRAELAAYLDQKQTPQLPDARHSPDFRSVHWYGKDYAFTASQAACVRVLWAAWETRTPDVGQETILVEAGAESKRLSHIFKRHPAWGTMIQPGRTKGAFRLKN